MIRFRARTDNRGGSERGRRAEDRGDPEPGRPQPRDNAVLLATRRRARRTHRRGRELVHVRDLGLAAGGAHHPRRGPARGPRPPARGRRRLLHPIATLWRSLLRRGLFQRDTRLGRFTAELHTPFDAFERASDAVARGNLKVFEEIGLECARYLEATAPGTDGFSGFVAGLRPGDPPDGQRYLRQAFQRYERLRDERDPGGARSSPSSRTSRSACTSRRGSSPRSSRRSTPALPRTRSSGGARSWRCSPPRGAGGRSYAARPPPLPALPPRASSGQRAGSRAK